MIEKKYTLLFKDSIKFDNRILYRIQALQDFGIVKKGNLGGYIINFEFVYYFQIGNKQVSFHSNIEYSNCPEFKGNWIGHRNESFPFKLK